MSSRLINSIVLILFAIVILLPLLFMFSSSLFDDGTFTLKFYRLAFHEARKLGLFYNTLIVGVGASVVSLFVGLPLAFFIARTDMTGKKYFRYLYLLPLLVPPYINSVVWIKLLGEKGSFNLLLMKLLSLDKPLFTIYGLGGVIFVLALSYFPFVTLIASSGLRSVSRNLEDSARLIHPEGRVLQKITLPLATPHIICGAIFVFIFSIVNYGVPALLRVNVYPIEIFTQFSAFYNEGLATATSLPLVLVTVGLVVFLGFLMKGRSFVSIGNAGAGEKLMELGRGKVYAFIFSSLLILFSVIIPILILLVTAGVPDIYLKALSSAQQQILTSLIIAFSGALLTVILSFFIAYLIERVKGWCGSAVDLLSLLPFAVPATVLGIGLIMLWNRPRVEFVYSSLLIVVFAHTARFFPFAVRIITAKIKQIKPNLEEAALLSGAGWLKMLGRVVSPLALPAILVSGTIVFILSMGELGATLLVLPPGKSTLPLRIYTIMHYGDERLVAALSLILILVTLIPVVILTACRRKILKFEKAGD